MSEVKRYLTENFCTDDFDQEIINYLVEAGYPVLGNTPDDKPNLNQKMLKYGTGNKYFWTSDDDGYVHTLLTKEQFKEWIGMTKKQEEKKDMKLSDLVSGKHVVEYRDGDLRLVLNVGWAGESNFSKRESVDRYYNSEMCNCMESSRDVVRVYELSESSTFKGLLRSENLKLLWERVEQTPEQIEAERIRKELEKLTEQLKKLEGK